MTRSIQVFLGDAERRVGTLRRWHHVGTAIGMTKVELDQFAGAFEHEERTVAQRIASMIIVTGSSLA